MSLRSILILSSQLRLCFPNGLPAGSRLSSCMNCSFLLYVLHAPPIISYMDLLDKVVQYEIYTARLPVCTVAADLLLRAGITVRFWARS